MPMRRLFPIAALPLAVLVPTLAGATAPTVPTEGSAFATKLDELPVSFLGDDPVDLTYVDMTLIWERLGVGTDPDDRMDAIGQLNSVDTYSQTPVLFGTWVMQVDEARSEVGFSTFEIEREAALIAPPYRVISADTTVSATDIAAAVATDPLWSPDLNDIESDAGPFWTWGDDPMSQDVTRRSPMRDLGVGGAAAVVGDDPATLIRTTTAEDVEAAIRTVAGADPSVADEGPFAASVAAIGEVEVVQAYGTNRQSIYMPPIGEDANFDSIAEDMASAIRFLPYQSLMVVETVTDGTYQVEILVNHHLPEIAEENATTAETWLAEGIDAQSGMPISELLPEAAISVDGSILRVTLPAGSYSRATRMLTQGALFPG